MFRQSSPLLERLSSRPTLILLRPLVSRARGLRGQELPKGVTHEQAKEVIKETWGRKLAAGIADRAGLKGKARDQFIESWSDVVSEGILR